MTRKARGIGDRRHRHMRSRAALLLALAVAGCHKPGLVDTVARVHDGDTLTLASGTRIRLAGIDANEMDGRCHHACAPLSARAARDALAGLVLHQRIACEPTGTSYKRVVAWCRLGSVDLSCAQVESGAAIVWKRYDPDDRLGVCAAHAHRS